MTSLLDIAPVSVTADIRGAKHPVPGVQAEGIVYLLRRFPLIGAVLANRSMRDMTADVIMGMAPEVIDAVLATGMGHPDSPEHEKAMGNLALDEKLEVLEKIFEATMPRGVGPFVETLNRLGAKAAGSGWAQDTKSPEQSNSS
jgi:hypothetical protein